MATQVVALRSSVALGNRLKDTKRSDAIHMCIHYVFSRMFTLEVFCVTEAAPYLLDARMTTVTAFPRQLLQTRGLMNKQAVADVNHLFRPAHSVSACR